MSDLPTKRRAEGFEPTPGALSQQERYQLRKELVELYAKGVDVNSLIHLYDYPPHTIEKELDAALNAVAEYFQKPGAVENFARHAVFHFGLIEQTDKLISTLQGDVERGNSKSATALINGIKLKSDLYQRIYDKGEGYHIIKQKPTAVDDMVLTTETQDLIKELAQRMKDSKHLLKELQGEGRVKPKKKSEMKVRKVRMTERGVKLANDKDDHAVLDHNIDYVARDTKRNLEDLEALERTAEALEVELTVPLEED